MTFNKCILDCFILLTINLYHVGSNLKYFRDLLSALSMDITYTRAHSPKTLLKPKSYNLLDH